MKKMIYLVRYAEIALKGKNRSEFETRLVENIKANLKGQKLSIKRTQGRILIESDGAIDLRRVFGIVSYSPCFLASAGLASLCEGALKIARSIDKTSTFRISTKRLTKDNGLSSMELNKKIGAFIAEKTGFKVNLDNPDLNIGIELIGKDAFLFHETVDCFGGLPVGVEGRVLALLSDEKSELAALLMMKRGCAVEIASLSPIKFDLLAKYSPNLTLHKISSQFELHELLRELRCKALIMGDVLGGAISSPNNILVLRPLIAFSDSDIAEEINAFRKAC
jgi:adenylyl- and sulfurtransferase ThiI